MPKTKSGEHIRVGDRVMICAEVTAVGPGEDYANVSLRFDEPCPTTGTKGLLQCNGRQIGWVLAETTPEVQAAANAEYMAFKQWQSQHNG